jgi:hypothetical protein
VKMFQADEQMKQIASSLLEVNVVYSNQYLYSFMRSDGVI